MTTVLTDLCSLVSCVRVEDFPKHIMVSGGADGVLIIWDYASGKHLQVYNVEELDIQEVKQTTARPLIIDSVATWKSRSDDVVLAVTIEGCVQYRAHMDVC